MGLRRLNRPPPASDLKLRPLGADYIDEHPLLARSGGEGEAGGELGKSANDLCGEMEEIVPPSDPPGSPDLYSSRLFMMR